jgi:YD repeat-containing protein
MINIYFNNNHFSPMSYATTIIKQIDTLVAKSKEVTDEADKLRATIKNVVITRNDDGNIIKEEWKVDGEKRDDINSIPPTETAATTRRSSCVKMCGCSASTTTTPTEACTTTPTAGTIQKITYDKTGNITETRWTLDGKLHRTDGPALVTYYASGNTHTELWYYNGIIFRADDDEPTGIEYKDDCTIITKSWYKYAI